jgi:5-methyltetrahydrofolate--homocysteine methyltransferase
MNGLELAKTIVDPERFEKFKAELATRRAAKGSGQVLKTASPEITYPQRRSKTVPALAEVPTPPDFERHVLRNTPIEQIWRFINPLMLYGRHLGVKGGTVRLLDKAHGPSAGTHPEAQKMRRQLEEGDPKSLAIWDAVEEVKREYGGTPYLQPSAVYRFFPAEAEGNRLRIGDTVFEFPRQKKEEGLCLADYARAKAEGPDNVALFVVTVGRGIRELAEVLKQRGDYLKSHIVQALALESAEAYAEYLHSQLRKMWGYPDAPQMTMMERFQAKYQGKRYSFGYPACPRLDDQAPLWKLLRPEEIGVQLTEGFMMDPESSVSALVFHHSQATYFSVGGTGSMRGGMDDDNR